LLIVTTHAFTAWDFEQPAAKQAAPVASVSVGTGTAGIGGGVQSRRFNQPPMSVFSRLVEVLASDAGFDWKGFDDIPGIVWRESIPLNCPDVIQLDKGHTRTATFMLSGFGETALPFSGVDGCGAVRLGNEGECSLSLNGDSEAVHEIVIVKYYPCDDVDGVLRRQVSETANLTPVDLLGSACDDPAQMLYTIVFSEGGSVFVAIASEEGGRSGPGFTTFVLTKNDPRQRIDQMRCREE
jgi:hypothetical protein